MTMNRSPCSSNSEIVFGKSNLSKTSRMLSENPFG